MENISFKLEPEFMKVIDRIMKKNRYMTKTEFIREAIRDKIRELEKQKMLKNLEKVFGSSEHKTTDEDLHNAREKAFEKLEKKFLSK